MTDVALKTEIYGGSAPAGTVKSPGLTANNVPFTAYDVTLAAQALLDDATSPAMRGTLDAAPRVTPVVASATDPSSFDWAANADVFSWTFTNDATITPSNVPTVVGATRVALVQSGGGSPPHDLTFTGATVYPTGDTIQAVASEIRKVIFETTGAGAYVVKQRVAIADIYNLQSTLDGKEAADADILKADVGDTMTAGYLSDDYSGGTVSSGTYTPAPATSQENFQYIVNGGAFTLAPPAASCSVILQITNNASAGAVTTSGFTKVDGDSFTTTNGHDFMCFIARCNGFSTLTVKALQ